jgi:hypothetical protein
MDLDARIRDADPARDLSIPPFDAEMPGRAQRHADGKEHRRRRYLIRASAASVAAATVLTFALAPIFGGSSVTPSSAVAAVLEKAAQAAPYDAAVTLGPGQFFYTEIRTTDGGYDAFGADASQRAYVTEQQTIQTWQAADGSDRQLVSYDGPAEFATSAGQKAWIVAGNPTITPPTNMPFAAAFPLGQEQTFGGPGVVAAPDNLSRLPTAPDALEQVINTDETGLSEVASAPTLPVSPAYTFSTAAQILAAPGLDASPALRSALYQLLATVPGTAVLGQASDHSGRGGIEIAGPLGGNGYGEPGDEPGVRTEVIIDPIDGSVLEIGQLISDPSLDSAEFKRYVGDSAGQLFDWTDYISSGVVGSPSETPPGSPVTSPTNQP